MWSAGQSEICGYSDDYNSWTCNVSTSYTETFAMLFSLESQSSPHYDIFGNDSNNSSSSSPNALSFIHGFIISILMLNILIAIVSYYFQMAIEKGEQTFWKNRLQFIVDCQSFFSLFKSCHGNCRREIDHQYDDDYDDQRRGGLDGEDYSRVEIDDDLHNAFVNGRDNSSHYFDREDMSSTSTSRSRATFVPVDRIAFGERINLDVYKRRLAKDDKDLFFRWWFNKAHNSRSTTTPPFKTRLKFFFLRASIQEIIFPGKEFENILMGIRYNEKGKGLKLFFARLASYILSAVNILLVFITLILGSVSFGLLWPTAMKENLFYVDTKSRNATDQHTVEVNELKLEMMNHLEEYEQTQEKKFERLLKKKEERERKRLAKVFKKQKEFTKKQKEHERRFDKIDQDLDDIKRMVIAIGTRLRC